MIRNLRGQQVAFFHPTAILSPLAGVIFLDFSGALALPISPVLILQAHLPSGPQWGVRLSSITHHFTGGCFMAEIHLSL
jgi:hypothetical protein